MSGTVQANLNGLFKVVYPDGIINLIPETRKILKMTKFEEGKKVGKYYEQPVQLTYEQGVTYAGSLDSIMTLTDPISMDTEPAQVYAYAMYIRSWMSYAAAAHATASGAAAFQSATKLQIANQIESITKRVELDMLYGQDGWGQVGQNGTVSSTATSAVLQLTTASWATGIWIGMENSTHQFWDRNEALVSSGADSIFTVYSIDPNLRQITFNGTSPGITALLSAITSGAVDIYPYGSRTGAAAFNQCAGLKKIITNTGTLFNISAAQYNLWKGNTYSAQSAQLNLGKLIKGMALPTARGLEEKVTVLVNDRTWSDLVTDQAALRKYDATYDSDTLKNGSRALTFYAQSGELEIVPYNCIKEGESFAIPMSRVKRIGATDITFNGIGTAEGQIFLNVPDKNAYEYRAQSHQAIFIETPARTLMVNQIVNNA